MTKTKVIIIAGGGTGGHIYPAIAIGRAIQKCDSNLQVRFVGTSEGLESKILSRENLPLHMILSGKLNFSGHPLKKIISLLKIPIGFLQSILLLLRFRPAYVIGVGGYASAPFVLMAALLCRKTAIWEPNAHPGMANRLLSKVVKRAYLVFADSQKYLSSNQVMVFGMPLREEIEKQQETKKSFVQSTMTILCFGGSQGSLFLNKKLSDFVLANPELKGKISFIHQTGPLDYKNMKEKYGDSCPHVEVHEFIYDMPSYYKRADIQFCRGGASTIAEASAFGVIPLIVPLPAADNHQLRNAEAVVAKNAGYLFKQDQFSDKEFKRVIFELLEDHNLRSKLSENLQQLAPRNAAGAIAKDIVSQL